jgi:arginine exporter protein ArgO
MLHSLIVFLGIAWLVAKVKRAFERPTVRRRLGQISGVVLVGLGLGLGIRLAADSL